MFLSANGCAAPLPLEQHVGTRRALSRGFLRPRRPLDRADGGRLSSAPASAFPEVRQGAIPMTIKVGDRIPNATLNVLKDGVQAVTTDEIFKGKKVVMFSLPGAFTPTCSAK